MLDRVGDGVAAELDALVFYKPEAACWKELDSLREDFVAFWEGSVDIFGDAGEAWDVVGGELAPGYLGLEW